ncbi:NAD(P)/FAD-dependent oxidoreductase [Diplocloster hominis]|uniref:NAD(P)/FAD-dependent oxidoreductase n=1 Tax=Diplocloster hominis TaxID=3079010 RepID=UPI0031BB7AA8
MYDVVIIGAGVTGCAIARELSRYQVKACVLEKCEDVCCGTSKANSAIAHAGFDALPGTKKAYFNIRGSEMMESVSKELDFPFVKNGSLVVCRKEKDLPKLQELYDRGVQNGVKDMRIMGRDEVHEMEPNLADGVLAALYAPTAGIVCPFGMTIAYAENAAVNGIEFRFDTEVNAIQKEEEGYVIRTSRGEYRTRAIVNAAGVYADAIHNMVSQEKLHITPRRGDYCLLDHTAGRHVARTIFPLPGEYGKGVLVAPTVHGNLILGPTAVDVEDKEETCVRQEELNYLLDKVGHSVKNIPIRQVITSFAGLRAHEDSDDFILGEAGDAKNFFDAAGIESPGLTSAPAIGAWMAEQLRESLRLSENPEFTPVRKGILNPAELSAEKRNELIRQQPEYGTIICRCEMISEGEIMDAIHRPVGARSLDGVKRRTRAGMGRCQSGFCSPRTMEILERELGLPMEEITKSGGASKIIVGINKDRW